MSDLNFVDRINNPQDYPNIRNEDGSVSTHRMAAEVDENGEWYAFPTIVQNADGKLHQFEDNREAMRHALESGEYRAFGKDKEQALSYAEGGYKKGSPLEDVRMKGIGGLQQ